MTPLTAEAGGRQARQLRVRVRVRVRARARARTRTRTRVRVRVRVRVGVRVGVGVRVKVRVGVRELGEFEAALHLTAGWKEGFDSLRIQVIILRL